MNDPHSREYAAAVAITRLGDLHRVQQEGDAAVAIGIDHSDSPRAHGAFGAAPDVQICQRLLLAIDD